MSIILCLLVEWEHKISEVVCSLISFFVCIFGRLTAFLALFVRCLTTYSANEANVSPLLRLLSSIPPLKTIKEGSIESKITPHFLQSSRALLASTVLMSPSSVNKARGSATSS